MINGLQSCSIFHVKLFGKIDSCPYSLHDTLHETSLSLCVLLPDPVIASCLSMGPKGVVNILPVLISVTGRDYPQQNAAYVVDNVERGTRNNSKLGRFLYKLLTAFVC